jgi:hypothetical protein
MNYADIFGVYRVGDFDFYSKVEAIEMHTKTGIHPYWDFNEAVYRSHNWTVEPSVDLSELYRRRAQQLRDKYDYLVLWYSSGADSDNVLRSFLDNDILIDEVASFVNFEGNGDKDDYYLNGEVYNIAAKNIEKYRETYPDLKHRLVDMCQPMIDFFSKDSTKFNWKYSMNTVFNPGATIRGQLSRTVTDWKRIIDSGKKVGFIWGTDKPMLNIVDGKYCFQFLDIVSNAVNPLWQTSAKPGEFNELFYWTPDMPEIVIKQSHIVKKYLQSSNSNSMYMTAEKTGLAFLIQDEKKWWISTFGVNSLIYPKYNFNLLNEFKPTSTFYSPRDNWFFKMNDSDIAYNTWQMSLGDLWKSMPDYWKNDPTDPKKAFKHCLSNPYFIE